MIRRPTPLPLTKTERDALDGLIRRGARALSPAEGNRLLRLWQLDQAERLQERRTARGLDKLNRELRRRLKEAQAANLTFTQAQPSRERNGLCYWNEAAAKDRADGGEELRS